MHNHAHTHTHIYTKCNNREEENLSRKWARGGWDSKKVNIEGIKRLTRELLNDVKNFREDLIDFLAPFFQRVIADQVNNHFILKAIRSFPLSRSLVSCVKQPTEGYASPFVHKSKSHTRALHFTATSVDRFAGWLGRDPAFGSVRMCAVGYISRASPEQVRGVLMRFQISNAR